MPDIRFHVTDSKRVTTLDKVWNEPETFKLASFITPDLENFIILYLFD